MLSRGNNSKAIRVKGLGLYTRDNGKMETAIAYWGYIWIMENVRKLLFSV